MSPKREDLKHSFNNYSSSPRNGTSSNGGERFGTKSTKYEEPTQYSWKRKSDSWDNTYLNEKSKFISLEALIIRRKSFNALLFHLSFFNVMWDTPAACTKCTRVTSPLVINK